MEIAKESIFRSAIRTFLKAFFLILGIFLAFIPIFLIIGAVSTDSEHLSKTTLTILPDAEGKKTMLPASSPVILQIPIHGVIGETTLTASAIESQLIESRQGHLKKDRIKGILLNINSPGGEVNNSDNIYRMILAYKEKYKIPVYAYVDGLCASGGYYIACAADKINTSPASIIGSIGVLMGPFFNINKALDKLGVQAYTFTEGMNKDMMSPFRPWTKDDEEALKNIAAFMYDRFVSIVTLARPQIGKENLIKKYGALVFDPQEAKKNGFVDNGDSSYNATLKELLKAANVDENKPYQVVELMPKHKWLMELMKGESPLFTGKIKHTLQIGKRNFSEKESFFSYLFDPQPIND